MNRRLFKFFTFIAILFIGGIFLSGCNEGEELNDIAELNNDASEEILKEEDLLDYLDKPSLEILALYGYPDSTGTYQGSVYWLYEDHTFFFHHEFYDQDAPFYVEETARVSALSSRKDGAECYGTKIGMTFNEIESVMGYEGDKYEDYERDDVVLFYHLKELKEGINDIELRFYAEDYTSPTKVLLIIWKGYSSGE